MTDFEVRDQRDPGWSWVDNEVYDIYARMICSDGKPLGVGPVAVYGTLARFAGSRGRCRLSLSRLAFLFGSSRPTMIKYLSRLEEVGLIIKETRKAANGVESECNEYILPKIKAPKDGGSKNSLPPGQKFIPGSQQTLPPRQDPLLPGQNHLPEVVNGFDRGSQAALHQEDLEKNREKTGGNIPVARRDSDNNSGKTPTPQQDSPSSGAFVATQAIPKILKDADGTVTYPHLAEVNQWFCEKFHKPLLPRKGEPELLAVAEAGLAQLAAVCAGRGDTLLNCLEVRCWLNLKKQARLKSVSDTLAELSAEVTYALQDLPAGKVAAAVIAPVPLPAAQTWQSETMSDEERYWREQATRGGGDSDA